MSEFLIANLLSDVRSSSLSPQVSQQEYGRLFDQDRLGFASSTEYLSRGAWRQSAVQHGTLANSSYAVDVLYNADPGQRSNNDLEQLSVSARFKQQITPSDSLYVQAMYTDVDSGDLAPNYANVGNPSLRVNETQEPMLLAGYHHQWSPGSHMLVLGGRLQDTLRVADGNRDVLVQVKDAQGSVVGLPAQAIGGGVVFPAFPQSALAYRSEFEAYTLELQQLWQGHHGSPAENGKHSLAVGGRLQAGSFETQADLDRFRVPGFVFLDPAGGANITNLLAFPLSYSATSASAETDLLRLSAYAYYNWQVADPLLLSVGLSYDWLEYPENHRFAPTSSESAWASQLSPKWGLIWNPWQSSTLRAAYTRSLGGVSLEQSFQLEPTQVGGFNQAYRSLIPESVVGSIPAAEFETWNLALEQKLGRRTFGAAQAQFLNSQADRSLGTFTIVETAPFTALPASTPEHLDYDERTLLLTLNQLVGRHWSFGARYRLSDAELQRSLRDVPAALSPSLAQRHEEATLHQVNLFAVFYHATGLFGSFESVWSQQSNRGYTPDIPGDDFWHLNAFVGYRFAQRHAELQLGLLNLTDRDYHLNPLNLTPELPRQRTLTVSCRFWF